MIKVVRAGDQRPNGKASEFRYCGILSDSSSSSDVTAETSLLNEHELANEREVIRRQARERRAMDAELCGMQSLIHENVIDREGREAGGKGAECPCRPHECSHVTQMPGNNLMCARDPRTVEISE